MEDESERGAGGQASDIWQLPNEREGAGRVPEERPELRGPGGYFSICAQSINIIYNTCILEFQNTLLLNLV